MASAAAWAAGGAGRPRAARSTSLPGPHRAGGGLALHAAGRPRPRGPRARAPPARRARRAADRRRRARRRAWSLIDGAPRAGGPRATLPDGVIVAELGARPGRRTRPWCASASTASSASRTSPARSTPRAGTAGLLVYVPARRRGRPAGGVAACRPPAQRAACSAARSWWSRRAPRRRSSTATPRPTCPGPVQASRRWCELYVGQGAELEHVSVDRLGRRGAPPRACCAPGSTATRARARWSSPSAATSCGWSRRWSAPAPAPTPGPSASTSPAASSTSSTAWWRATRRPQAYSNLLYKGAIQDHAHTVFFGNLVVPPGAPGHRRLPDQPQPGAQRGRPRRHDPVPRDRDGRGQVLPRRRGGPRGRRAPLLPASRAACPRRRRQAADRDGLPPGGPGRR